MPDLDRTFDLLLALRCQAGDPAAFAELVGRFHPRLLLYVRKLLAGAGGPSAEDVLQDVWLDAHRGLSRLRDSGALRGWLYRLARDRAWQALRRRRGPIARAVPLAAVGEVAAPPGEEPAFAADDAAAIHAALDRLTPGHREVLLLRFVEGMTYEQAAAVVGCPVGTVRSRLHHAKRCLAAALGKDRDA